MGPKKDRDGDDTPAQQPTPLALPPPVMFDMTTGDWNMFIKRMLNTFTVYRTTEDELQKAYLLPSLVDPTYRLLISLCLPDDPQDKTFDELRAIFTKHFTPASAYFVARKAFYRATQAADEQISAWAARLRLLAVERGFGAELDVVLRDTFVIGLASQQIQDRVFEEDPTKPDVSFASITAIALSREASSRRQQASPAEPFHFVSKNANKKRFQKKGQVQPASQGGQEQSSRQGQSAAGTQQQKPCSVCGRSNHGPENCFYKEYSCLICGIGWYMNLVGSWYMVV